MAETSTRQPGAERRRVKMPVIGPVNRQWVMVGGALIVGIVGYAWWNRNRSVPEEVLPEDIPQDREPPSTVVGTESFDPGEVSQIINTNTEWYTRAVEYLSNTGGYDFTFTTLTLGKYLARRQLTESEANLVQAAKGAVGEPPQGGPWPIIRAGAAGPPSPTTRRTEWAGTRLTSNTTWIALARQRASEPSMPNSVEQTKRDMFLHNPTIIARIGKRNDAVLKAGWIVVVPIHHKVAA